MLAQGGKGAFGKELKERFRVFRDSKVLQFETYAEWLPTAGTAVSVEDSVLDRYGLPVAAITIDRHPADLPVTRYLIERGEDLAPGDGAGRGVAGDRGGRDDHPPARHLPLRGRPGHERPRP